MFKYIEIPKDDQKVGDLTQKGNVVLIMSVEIIEHIVKQLGKATETSSDHEVIERNVWLREDLSEILENVRSK